MFASFGEWVGANVLTIIFGVFGVVGTIYGIMVAKREKKPCYAIKTMSVVKNARTLIPGVDIRHTGHEEILDSLSITVIAFWNAGRETLNRNDVVKNDKIKFVMKGDYKILSASVIQSNRNTNEFECVVSEDKKEVQIRFEYLARFEGGVLEIIHNGNSSEDLELKGTIKGVEIEKVKEENDKTILERGQEAKKYVKATQLVLLLALPVTVILTLILSLTSNHIREIRKDTVVEQTEEVIKYKVDWTRDGGFWWIVGVGSLGMAGWLFMMYLERENIVPRGLEKYLERRGWERDKTNK